MVYVLLCMEYVLCRPFWMAMVGEDGGWLKGLGIAAPDGSSVSCVHSLGRDVNREVPSRLGGRHACTHACRYRASTLSGARTYLVMAHSL